MSDMKCPNIKIYKCSDGFVTDNEQVAKSHEANIKSNKPKCPICGNVLEQSDGFPELFMCLNCQINMKHNQWQELIRTRKALDYCIERFKSLEITTGLVQGTWYQGHTGIGQRRQYGCV